MDLVDSRSPSRRTTRLGDRPLLLTYAAWITLVTVAVVGIAAFLTFRETKTYSATTRVVVTPRVFPGGSPAQPPDMGTEAAVAASAVVKARAADALQEPASAMTGISVKSPPSTQLLDITATSTSAQEAQSRSAALARAYMGYLDQQGVPVPHSTTLKPPVAGFVQASVISPATLPSHPASPNVTLNLVVAGILGLVLGVVTAIARDRLNTHLRGIADLADVTGMPVLGAVPAARRRWRLRRRRGSPDLQPSEVYRYLRARVQQTLLPDGGTLLITGPTAKSGCTTTALHLAQAFAATGAKVALVGGNLRDDAVSRRLGLDTTFAGLTTVLAQRSRVEEALLDTGITNLRLLPAGGDVPAPGDLLAGSGLQRVMTELLETADIVIVDAPAILSSSDAVALLRVTDAALLVVDGAHTGFKLLAQAAEEVRWAGGVAVATVVTTGARRSRRWYLGRVPSVPFSVGSSHYAMNGSGHSRD